MSSPLVIGLLVILLSVLALGRMAWRLWRGEEEMQAGGSLGRQLLGRKPRAR
jgi:hypothetical protein